MTLLSLSFHWQGKVMSVFLKRLFWWCHLKKNCIYAVCTAHNRSVFALFTDLLCANSFICVKIMIHFYLIGIGIKWKNYLIVRFESFKCFMHFCWYWFLGSISLELKTCCPLVYLLTSHLKLSCHSQLHILAFKIDLQNHLCEKKNVEQPLCRN